MEKFIRENRPAFDSEMPSHRVWEKIEGDLHPVRGRMVPLSMVYRIAASIVLILAVGVLLGYYVGSQSQAEEIQRQMAGMERYYQKKMDKKMVQLADYQATDQVRSELTSLENGYARLASETPLDKEKYLRAVMTNFEARLALLERVLLQMEKYSKEGKNNENEIKDLQI